MTTDLGTQPSGSAPAPEPRRAPRRSPAWWRGFREIVLIVGLWLCYSLGRNLADQDAGDARRRAIAIFDLEKALHIDLEHWLNHGATGVLWLSVLMCFWYAALHYTITPIVLAYVYIRHRDDYSRVRNALVLACVVALICYIWLPTAPPRLTEGFGFEDTLSIRAQYGWWSQHASAPKGFAQLTNELAAMPSLHVGWTVWVAWVLRRHFTSRIVRGLGVFYVVGTTAVVLCTANHWLLDVVAGIALVLASIYIVNHVEPLRRDDGFVHLYWQLGRRLRRARAQSRAARADRAASGDGDSTDNGGRPSGDHPG